MLGMNAADISSLRNEYRTLRAAVIAVTGETPESFDRRAEYAGTQDGEGEPATPLDFVRGAQELAYDLRVGPYAGRRAA